ncbi:MAG: DUF1727 domain-containing protein [Oscillospiraceae bacterium]|nr:DUF1727 domain-containing protein [Oscillospiraceae bacterium]
MRFLFTLWVCKFISFAVNIIDKKRGSNYSGKIAVKLMPKFVAHFKNINYNKVFFISGTNGKSTTTNLLYHTLISAGKTVACNTEGANMMGGVATTLIKNSTLSGALNKEYLVLEIDERSFPGIRKVLPGRNLALTNLQKDQVQRNGDPDFILRKIRGAIDQDMTLFLNNEEPRSHSLEDFAGKTVYFSVEKNSESYVRDDFYNVTLPCPKCFHPIAYDYYNLASIGRFHCTRCDYQSKKNADVTVSEVDFERKTFLCGESRWTVPYCRPFYIYNFAVCIAICREIGLADREILNGFQSFTNPASHATVMQYNGKEIHYLRGKQENPEALQSQLDIIASDNRKKAVFVGMYEITDFYPHYGGSFYFFDCDFAPVVSSNAEYFVAFSSTVANDIASRMLLAGAPEDRVAVVDSNDTSKIFASLDQMPVDVVYILTNTVHAPEIKKYFTQGGTANG